MAGEMECFWWKKRDLLLQYRLFYDYIGADINIVPEDICHDVIEPLLNPFRYCKYYADKNAFEKIIPGEYLPKTILRRMNGFYYDVNYHPISFNEEKLTELLNLSSGKIILKPSVGGSSGRNVMMFCVNGDLWLDYYGQIKLTTDFLDHYNDDFVIQDALKQSQYMNQFNHTSINTLRLTVYRSVKTDKCHVISGIMRIGNNGVVVDNAHSGGKFIGIRKDGTLCDFVSDQYGVRFNKFNGIDFSISQFRIPNYQKVVDFAKMIGSYIPHHRLLALDIALNENNMPVLIEFNVEYYSMWLFQFTVGPALGDFTDEIVDYCKSKIDDIEYCMYF